MHRSVGPPKQAALNCEMLRTNVFGLGTNVAGRNIVDNEPGRAGIAITTVNGGERTLMAAHA